VGLPTTELLRLADGYKPEKKTAEKKVCYDVLVCVLFVFKCGRSAENTMPSDRSGNPGERPWLSIIVPAYNEEQRLSASLDRLTDFAEKKDYAVEVIVIDNGSADGTAKIVRDVASGHPFVRYLYEGRRGKGAAVRKGMLAGRGEHLLMCDADLAVPIDEADRLLSVIRAGADIAIGSREVKGAKRYGEPFSRHLMGRVFNLIVQSVLLPGVRDSQCGFKCFSRAVVPDLFETGVIDGWGFDAEILYIAKLRGYRMTEVPVPWYYGQRSKVNPLLDAWHMFREVLKVRDNARKGIYGR
jgi:dolichyl-phosphate beta-glucosyltransferase